MEYCWKCKKETESDVIIVRKLDLASDKRVCSVSCKECHSLKGHGIIHVYNDIKEIISW